MDCGLLSAVKSVVWSHRREVLTVWGNTENIILPLWILVSFSKKKYRFEIILRALEPGRRALKSALSLTVFFFNISTAVKILSVEKYQEI